MAAVTIALGTNLNLYRTSGMAETANHVFRQRIGADPFAALVANDLGSSDFNVNRVWDSQGNDISDRYSMRNTGNFSVYYSGTLESAALYQRAKGYQSGGSQTFLASIPARNLWRSAGSSVCAPSRSIMRSWV